MSWRKKTQTPEIPDNMTVMELIHEARMAQDPRHAYALLKRAEVLAPDSIEVQRALLMHGRLHERDRRAPDFSVIKSYLLHAFEHPEKHSEEQQRQMVRELFDDKRLQHCLALAQDPQAFLRDYLKDLAQEYMRIFIAGDNSHVPRVFGISNRSSMHRYLAVPAADLLHNVFLCPFLSEEEQLQVGKAFYEAFYRQVDGNTKELDRKLGAQLCARLAQ